MRLVLLLLLVLPFTSGAQIDYVWDQYNLQITVPEEMTVLRNTDTEFELEGEHLMLAMYLFEEDISLEDMDEAVISTAADLGLDEVEEVFPVDINGLEGVYVEGTMDGMRAVFAGLIDAESLTNFFILIGIIDGDEEGLEQAVDVLTSLSPVD